MVERDRSLILKDMFLTGGECPVTQMVMRKSQSPSQVPSYGRPSREAPSLEQISERLQEARTRLEQIREAVRRDRRPRA